MDKFDYLHITAVPEVLQNYDSLHLHNLVTTGDFISRQANDPRCDDVASFVEKPSFAILHDSNVNLVRPLKVDSVVQRVVPTVLCAWIQHLYLYLV